MKIRIEEDVTGFAPADHRFVAYDDDTYDGAEDSPNRYHYGCGSSPEAAVAALRLRLWELDHPDWEVLPASEVKRSGEP